METLKAAWEIIVFLSLLWAVWRFFGALDDIRAIRKKIAPEE